MDILLSSCIILMNLRILFQILTVVLNILVAQILISVPNIY